MVRWLLSLFFPFAYLAAFVIGNPGEPSLFKRGIIDTRPCWWSFRVGYIGDYTYREQLKDEFQIQNVVSTPTHIQFYTNAGVLTFNLKSRIDVYGICGATRIQVDEEIFSKTQLAWGIGGKIMVFHHKGFRVGLNASYFETDQKPLYFLSDNLPFNVATPSYRLNYSEIQVALGATYRTSYFAPYLNATYLYAKLDPTPLTILAQDPTDPEELVQVDTKSAIANQRWGLAIGLTLIDQKKSTLTVEWRTINQNAVSFIGQLRF